MSINNTSLQALPKPPEPNPHLTTRISSLLFLLGLFCNRDLQSHFGGAEWARDKERRRKGGCTELDLRLRLPLPIQQHAERSRPRPLRGRPPGQRPGPTLRSGGSARVQSLASAAPLRAPLKLLKIIQFTRFITF